MEENVTLDFNKALQALDQVSETFTVDVWVPSLKTFIKFKQLDAKQQKELLGTVIDTSVYNINFVKVFYNIIKDNNLSQDVDINELTIVDKIVIGLYLKSKISDEVTVFFGEKNEISQKFLINEILEKFKTYKTPEPLILQDESDKFNLKIEIFPVTIKTEYDYDSQNKNNKKAEDVKTTEDIQKIVTESFLGEISKFLSKIWINGTEIPMVGMSFVQKTRLVEKLPSTLIQKIIDNISIWKSQTDDILRVKHEEYTKVISLDGSIFLS
jgi:hypothetical protein